MEDQKQKIIDKCKFKICFYKNGIENFEKMLKSFKILLHAEENLLQTLIPKTGYEKFLSERFKSGRYEPEIIKKANKIIEKFSKGEGNNGRKR